MNSITFKKEHNELEVFPIEDGEVMFFIEREDGKQQSIFLIESEIKQLINFLQKQIK